MMIIKGVFNWLRMAPYISSSFTRKISMALSKGLAPCIAIYIDRKNSGASGANQRREGLAYGAICGAYAEPCGSIG